MLKVEKIENKTISAIALRGIVLFPGITTNFEVARRASIKALKDSEDTESEIFLVAQRDPSVIEPTLNDLYKVGIVARIINSERLTNGNYQLMAEGIARAELDDLHNEDGILKADITIKKVAFDEDFALAKSKMNDCVTVIEYYLKFFSKPSEEVLEEIRGFKDPSALADCAASAFLARYEDKQQILEIANPITRLDKLIEILETETEKMELEGVIQTRVRQRLSKTQKEIYLREQLRVIENELESEGDDYEGDEYESKIKQKHLPKEVEEKLLDENSKLEKMPFGTPEATVIRNYIETCLELPWSKYSKDRTDIKYAQKILDEDHDGLNKVKERIIEFMAVKQLSPQLDGQIICLVGPPGVGKTSVAKSIARATNRKYVRISLGGIRDEAEIRGHRKTYIGSMPGRIINALKIAGTANPVMLLDEVDKLTKDAHGDPTSALLEVLDVDQNKTFRDHFIEIPIDLSECLFIATANTTETIPLPLLDRMEVIYMESYSDTEKLSIAKNHLIPRQLKRHGLKKTQLKFTESGIFELIARYTKESGVRNLEREIASVCRKTAKQIVGNEIKNKTVDTNEVITLLGPEKYLGDSVYPSDEVGMVNGLAWTQLGGEMLRIEVVSMNGNGNLELTGSLGDVMKESAKAAVSYIRKHAKELQIPEDFHKTTDIHIHVPEGAIPKDGPSAGITITTAIISELTGRSVKQSFAMTGEITLTGRVLQIGGLKEKSAAAYKSGVKSVIIPNDNLKDINEFDDDVKNGINFIGVSNISEVLPLVLN